MSIQLDNLADHFWLVAIIGILSYIIQKWVEFYVGRRDRRNAKLEELRDRDLKKIEEITFAIRKLVADYWTTENDFTQRNIMKASIIGQLGYLSTLIDQLFKNHEYEREQMRKVYAKFWLVCTSGDFGVKTIKK